MLNVLSLSSLQDEGGGPESALVWEKTSIFEQTKMATSTGYRDELPANQKYFFW